MLRKLLKHEWKAVNKVMITVNLGIVLLTIFGSMILSTDTFDNEEAFPLAILLVKDKLRENLVLLKQSQQLRV